MTCLFENDWLVPIEHSSIQRIEWQLSVQAQRRIRGMVDVLYGHMIESRRSAVVRLGERLGSNPVVALSGGIDSQAACLSLMDAGVAFTVAILVFEDGFNLHDVQSAYDFCIRYDLPHVEVRLDIMKFLGRGMGSYVVKYDCPSPQITAHLWFYEQLIEMGASSIVCGGNPPYYRQDEIAFVSTRSQTAWMRFSEINSFLIVGNFLSYSLDIALPLLLATSEGGYANRVAGMHHIGLPVVGQGEKLTGFEKIKEHFKGLTGDGWSFEKMFRQRYTGVVPEYTSVLNIPDDIRDILYAKRLF